MSTPIYVLNNDSLFFSIEYRDNGDPERQEELKAEWKTFERFDPATRQDYQLMYRPSNHIVEVQVDYRLPPNTPAGRYRVETFIPGKHATSRKAVFTVVKSAEPPGQMDARLDETLAVVDMNEYYDVWFPLADLILDPSQHPFVGRVRQFDITLEDPPTELSFGPVRWVPLAVRSADERRFDAPVGTPEEREQPFPSGRVIFGKYPIWVGEWFDVNPFLNWYIYGSHTGADLNLPGSSGADKGKPIYSIGDGIVTYAGRAGSWGNIIVIRHPEALVIHPDGHSELQPVYSRYGHVDNQILVRAGEGVSRGQNIGFIGLAAGATSGWHLHFDISYTDILQSRPAHWPNLDGVRSMRSSRYSDGYSRAQASVRQQVLNHYVDPMRFLQDNHNVGPI